MSRHFTKPADWHHKLRPNGSPARLLVVDPDPCMTALLRQVFRWHGFTDPETVGDREEALDLLGAVAQRIDLVLIGLPSSTGGDAGAGLVDVLSQIRSPVRLACYGGAIAGDLGAPQRLIGMAAYFDLAGPRGVARDALEVLASPWTVRHILDTGLVPQTLDRRWAEAVYGARPGRPFARTRARDKIATV